MRAIAIIGVAFGLTSCSSYDNSSDTDRPRSALTKAQSAVSEQSSDVAARSKDIEREKRDLVQRHERLVDDEQSLVAERQELGSARDTLAQARTTYATAVNARLGKLDATLASLANRTEATSKDAAVGLLARRDRLKGKIQAMPATLEQDWAAYTKDVDATFDAIERDLDAAR
jgi:chromosome segregation ATPase